MSEDTEALAAACRALARVKPPPVLTWNHQGYRWELLGDGKPTGIGVLHENGYHITTPKGDLDIPPFDTLDDAQECGVGKV